MNTTVTQKNLKQILFIGYLLCFMHLSSFAQNDSLQILLNNVGNSNVEIRTKSMRQIYELAKKQDNQDLMDFFKKSLEICS